MTKSLLRVTVWPVLIFRYLGVYFPAKLRFLDKLLATLPANPLHQMPVSDLRDWTAIRAWASNLAAKLQPALPQ